MDYDWRERILLSTTVRAEGGSLATVIPAEAVNQLALEPGAELLWVKDGQGGFRIRLGGKKTRRILGAHEEAITDSREVFRELAK